MSAMHTQWTTATGANTSVAVLQLTPSAPIKLGTERLWGAPSGGRVGPGERQILEATEATSAGRGDFAVVLRARDDKRNLWCIDPALDDDEAERVAESVIHAQLALYRELLARRAIAFFVVGLTLPDAILLRGASARKARELAPGAAADRSAVGSDSWLVGRYAVFTSARSDETLNHLLPQMANVLGRRGERARRHSQEFAGWVPPKVG